MFTGLIRELGRVERLERGEGGARLFICAPGLAPGLSTGDSIAVDGCCLTAVHVEGEVFAADAMPETLRVTTLGRLRPGDPVNLEPTLRLADGLGGHLVTGHVDGVGRIARKEPFGNAVGIEIEAPSEVLRYIVPKGSIAVDGVSLTVVRPVPRGFQVSVIPHTAATTTLGRKGPGDLVNLEADLIGKYVERFMALDRPRPSGGEPGAAGQGGEPESE